MLTETHKGLSMRLYGQLTAELWLSLHPWSTARKGALAVAWEKQAKQFQSISKCFWCSNQHLNRVITWILHKHFFETFKSLTFSLSILCDLVTAQQLWVSPQVETSGKADNCILLSVFCHTSILHMNSKRVTQSSTVSFFSVRIMQHNKLFWEIRLTLLESIQGIYVWFCGFHWLLMVINLQCWWSKVGISLLFYNSDLGLAEPHFGKPSFSLSLLNTEEDLRLIIQVL